MKTFVVNQKEDTRVPFLRGILTHSLLDAGLPFTDAFELATALRKELSGTAEISSESLHELVCARLEESGHESALDQYRQPVGAPIRILVRGASGSGSAFSRGRHERYLQSSGIAAPVTEFG